MRAGGNDQALTQAAAGPLGAVGSHIVKQAPDFDPRNWRYPKLVDLVTAIGAFEVERAGQSVRVREKPKRRR